MPGQAVPGGVPRSCLWRVTQTHVHETLREGRWSFHCETVSSLVWKQGNFYLAAQERLALCSLLLVFQEGDVRKLPAAFPKGRSESWDPTAGVGSLQTNCLSTSILQPSLYNPACCNCTISLGEASLSQSNTDLRQTSDTDGKILCNKSGRTVHREVSLPKRMRGEV